MRRIPELDGLRGIAAIVIVVFHMRFLDAYPAMGTAVDLFFVLSGYLITAIILAEGRAPGFFRAFYARRGLRIWPIYYLGLAICVALNPLLRRPEPLDGLWAHAAYLQGLPKLLGGVDPPFSRLFSHAWTLAIEEQFYLAWPLVVVMLGARRLGWAVAGLVITPVVLRGIGLDRHLLPTRCDGLGLGALLALILREAGRREGDASRLRRGFATIGVAAILARQVGGPLLTRLDGGVAGPWTLRAASLATAELAWLYFALVGLVLVDRGHRRLAWLRDPRLVRLGLISYGIYLYHPFVLQFAPMILKRLGIKGSPWWDVAKVVACVGLAEVSWRLIERPILGLKRWFPYEQPPDPLRGPHRATAARSIDRPMPSR